MTLERGAGGPSQPPVRFAQESSATRYSRLIAEGPLPFMFDSSPSRCAKSETSRLRPYHEPLFERAQQVYRGLRDPIVAAERGSRPTGSLDHVFNAPAINSTGGLSCRRNRRNSARSEGFEPPTF